MRSVNKATLLGNVGAQPEIRTTGSGVKVAKFSLATSWGKGDKERTQWHRITAWDKTADIVEKYVNKGDRLYLEGSIEYSTTEGEDGTPKYWTDIVAREVVMLGGGKEKQHTPFDDDD